MGWCMLQNDHRIIYKGTDSIAIVGVENSGKPPFPDRGDLPKALQGTDGHVQGVAKSRPRHTGAGKCFRTPRYSLPCQVIPTTCKSACRLFGVQVYLSGTQRTVFGGQPGALYVNIGLGYVLFPMRLGAWPEITVLTLKK